VLSITTIVYIAITGWLLALVVANLYREEKWLGQLTCALVMIPLLLRLLGVK
jgi:hypothetical protein